MIIKKYERSCQRTSKVIYVIVKFCTFAGCETRVLSNITLAFKSVRMQLLSYSLPERPCDQTGH